MSRYTIEGETLTGIADAVRSITGGETLLTPAQIEAEIEGTAATMQEDISDLKTIITTKPDVKDSDAEDVDLDVSDPSGNVILRLADGHIKTKEFDSSEITEDVGDLKASVSSIEDDIGDLDTTVSGKLSSNQGSANAGKILGIDTDGSVIPTEGGSENVDVMPSTALLVDLDISDNDGNVLARFSNGHVKTKNFDSSDVSDVIKNTKLLYTGVPEDGQVLFTSADVSVGDEIVLIFEVRWSGYGSYIDIKNTSNSRITYIGRPSGGSYAKYIEKYVIPSNFGKAVVASLNEDMTIHAIAPVDSFFGYGFFPIWQYLASITDSSETLIDYKFSTQNRLANPLFTSREKYNADNPNSQIQEETALYKGVTGNAGYRIPAMCVTNDGTILVCGTHMTNAAGDYGDFSVDVARKPSGGNWSISEVVPFDSTREDYGSVLNNEFLVDRNTDRIYLFYGTEKKKVVWWEVETEDGDYRYIYSDNDGVTWSSPVSLKSLWDTDAYDYCIPSCTKGVMLTNGTYVVPSFCKKGTSSSGDSYPLLLIKPLNGDWYFSSVASVEGYGHMDECAVVEGATENEIWLYCRPNYNYGTGVRRGYNKFVYDITNDTFTHVENSYFDTNRHNCFSVDKITINTTPIYLMSFTDTHASARENLTLWASLDGNKWIRVYRVNKESSNGYSVLDNYNGQIGIAYEDSDTTYGNVISYQDLSPFSSLIHDSAVNYIERNIGIQDRMQMLFNAAKGID